MGSEMCIRDSLWGGVGAFLSAPLTVIMMIIFAEFKTTRPIAIMLSADGDPTFDPKKKPEKSKTSEVSA